MGHVRERSDQGGWKALEYGWVLLAVILRLLSASTAPLGYLFLVVYALTGRARSIKALGVTWLLTMLNPALAPQAPFVAVGRFLVIGAAAASVFLRSQPYAPDKRFNALVLWTILLGGFIGVHGALISAFPVVSVLKAFVWTISVAALLAAWLGLDARTRTNSSDELFHGLVLIVVMSLPLLISPVGYFRNGRGFQGVLNHPQVFGSTAALLGAWAMGRMFQSRDASWTVVAVALASPFLVGLSEARTAGLALVFGVITAILVGPLVARKYLTAFAPGLKSRRLMGLCALAIAGGLISAPVVSNAVGEFITKRSDVGSIPEAYGASRGQLINRMWQNVQEHPIEGIGFGVASDPENLRVRTVPSIGVPVGASIEKGVMPLAVLEELGAFGLALTLVWLLALTYRSARAGVVTLSVACVVLFLNMGESTLFSPGGFGLLTLILLSWAATGLRPRVDDWQ